jgi:hypothetical protein
MATATPRPIDRPALDRRVRHPLQALRGYIRTYVVLEGAAIALIYLALWFWIGVLLDYGTFKLFAFDWIQELNQNLPTSTATIVRGVLLAILLVGLLAVVAAMVFLRFFREFRDAALALVLERRFPRELGDRLITAVELADPRLAATYGYSQAMVDATIQDAADRIEKLPVRDVFDWARLRRQWLVAAVLTLGIYLLVALGSCTLPRLFGAEAPTPGQFVWRMRDVSAIWFERQVLLQNSYWPRQAYLEVIRFQETSEHPGEMRVGRDEQRPDVLVRAVQWVIADRQAPDGWRALRWSDLPRVLPGPVPDIALPADWPDWVIDLDDLDREVPPGVLPPEWQGKKSGFLRAELARPERQALIHQAHATDAVERLLDWQAWTIDKIELQLQPQRRDVREALRSAGQEASLQAFEHVLSELAQRADDPHMSRTLRQLKVPTEVRVNFRGKTTKSSNTQTVQEDHKYSIKLDQLKESVRFTVLGEDYYTPSLSITLVPPPAISHLSMTREEPAYLYYRLQGDQMPLKGKKQVFRDVGVSITGETSTIQVPLGTNLELKAQADRDLRGDIRMLAPANREESGSITPAGQVRLLEDKRTFVTQFAGVSRPLEFDYEFHDRDNVKGHRRIVIKPIDDRVPEIIDVEMAVVLRKPRFKADPGKSGQNPAADGYLVTPRALLPFKGTIRDDYGLTRAAWAYEIEEVEFELLGDPRGDKKQGPGLVLGGSAAGRRARYIAAGQAFWPVGVDNFAPAGWAWIAQLVKVDLALAARRQAPEEGAVPLERFQRRLEEHAGDELTPAALDQRLAGPPPRSTLLKEHSLKEEEGFDFNKHLAKLQSKDPQKEAQLHYQVRLAIAATDNNVETGPGTGRTKMPLNFLIVSENELLAQVLAEEDGLRERLEKAVHRLRDHKSILDEQVGKVDDPKSDLGLIAIRVEEVRKSILDGASTAREVYADYSRILRELEANRVSAEKILRVDSQICKPLEAVIQPRGEFAITDEMVQNLSQALEGDAARQKTAEDAKKMDQKLQDELAAGRLGHHKAIVQSRDSLVALIDRLEAVLRAMDQELVLGNVVGLLVEIERTERQAAARWDAYHAELMADIFRELGGEAAPNNPQKR